ncbi:MAG: YncE family protein [Cyclobacteriaceae bacterium]
MKKASICLLLVSFFILSANAQSPTYKFLKKIDLPGDGKWDYLKMDGERERLFVSHFDRVHVIDLKTDKPIGEITGLKGVHGVALAKDLNKGYITNGTDNTITVFDYNTFKVLKTITVAGKKADAVMYDTPSKQIFVFNNGSGNAVVINAQTDEVVSVIEVGGAPEFAVADGKGTVFNNNEDTNEVTVIDAKTLKVKNHFSLLPNEVATGLGIDVANNRLFSGCRKTKSLVVLDATTGKIIQTLPIGGGVDAVVYEKDLKLIMTSNGEGNVTIIKQESADKYSVVQTLVTKPGCKTMVHRGTTHNIYLSGADYLEDGKTVKPGTFGVFVYSMK